MCWRVGSESARVHVHLLQISFTSLLAGAGPLLKDFAVHLKHSRLRKVTFDWCTLTFVDAATLLAEGLSENRTLEQLCIYSHSSTEVRLYVAQCVCLQVYYSNIVTTGSIKYVVVSLMTLHAPRGLTQVLTQCFDHIILTMYLQHSSRT